MLYEILQTRCFSIWLAKLRDSRARAKIARRIDRMRRGNFGDVERGDLCIVLLCGGDKGSQQRDIREARKLAKEV